MNGYDFIFAGTELTMLPSGALWWGQARTLCVSDLHLGKSERIARRGGTMLPPYETHDTLARLALDIERCAAATVICLGDSFDDLEASENLDDADALLLSRLMAGRRWVWIEGNHDPGPVEFGGTHLAELHAPPLTFRHIARPGAAGEISGHYHPKARVSLRGRRLSRPCLLHDSDRVILPAYGTYTGGLRADDAALARLMRAEAVAVLVGGVPRAIPMPRR
ncbi:ligase-associated DNA damage response endonuclease PdeM [Aliiroseovarius subalbicans]|uniref:ligase-associated DNA damage response endonuclease PdeM n=1 Tax=Aliiroseovarius subalbicans TaxID=2925840 RepID=UPI001F56D827|nr:ligase-associated DNA damage response endonuclease PdeM [Aliiroseovarius subalbicans]MCI2397953.1 ligase-associated DNA damage response endonuclease PdeM [Aliiroseovarius subalbicans]